MGFEKGLDNIGSGLDSLKTKLAGVASMMGLAFGTKELIETAAAVNAEGSALAQTFGAFEDAAVRAMQRVGDASGILRTRLQATGTQIYAFAKTSGMDSVTALGMMEDALTVAADSAAYYDRSLEETAATLQSFLKGNYANDAALGLSATETTRNAAAMALYGKKFAELSEAQKQLALLQMVKDANRLSGAMGQAARESEGWENVLGNLKEAWRQLMAVVGQPVLRGAIAAVKSMTTALTYLTEHAQTAVNTLNKLFGWEQENAASAAASIAQSVENQNALTDAVEETAKAQQRELAGFDKITKLGSEDTAEAVEVEPELVPDVAETPIPSAEEAADRAEAVFDRLLGIAAPLQAAWEQYGDSIEGHLQTNFENIAGAVRRCADATLDWLGELDYAPLLRSVDGVLEALEPLTEDIGGGLEWFWNNVLLPLGKWSVEDALPASLDVLSGALDVLDASIEALRPYGRWLWEEFIQPLASWTGEIIVTGLEALADVLHDIGDWIREHPDAAVVIGGLAGAFGLLSSVIGGGMFTKLLTNFGQFAAVIGSLNVTIGVIIAGIVAWGYVITELHDNWQDIMDVIEESGGVFGFLQGWLEDSRGKIEEFFNMTAFSRTWNKIWQAVGGVVFDITNGIKSYFSATRKNISDHLDKIKYYFRISVAYVKEQIAGFPGWLREKANAAWRYWSEPFEQVGAFFYDKFHTAFDKIGEAFSGVKRFAQGLWSDIQAPFLHVADWFRETFSHAWQEVLGVFSRGGTVFQGIEAGISSVFKSTVNGLIDGINNVIAVPFWNISEALRVLREWNIWLPWAGDWRPFEWLPSIDIPQIPRLAQGTVVPANYGEFLAVLGDNKREAEVVSPLSTIEAAVGRMLDQKLSGMVIEIHNEMELDSRPVYKSIVRRNADAVRMTGKNPLIPEGGTA